MCHSMSHISLQCFLEVAFPDSLYFTLHNYFMFYAFLGTERPEHLTRPLPAAYRLFHTPHFTTLLQHFVSTCFHFLILFHSAHLFHSVHLIPSLGLGVERSQHYTWPSPDETRTSRSRSCSRCGSRQGSLLSLPAKQGNQEGEGQCGPLEAALLAMQQECLPAAFDCHQKVQCVQRRR
jgi:hypothetical protein